MNLQPIKELHDDLELSFASMIKSLSKQYSLAKVFSAKCQCLLFVNTTVLGLMRCIISAGLPKSRQMDRRSKPMVFAKRRHSPAHRQVASVFRRVNRPCLLRCWLGYRTLFWHALRKCRFSRKVVQRWTNDIDRSNAGWFWCLLCLKKEAALSSWKLRCFFCCRANLLLFPEFSTT